VFEHVIVMEGKLGRLLEADETVRHLNGVKDDNRPENLELWVRPPPSGIRATDAVAWAKEILARYDGPSDSPNNAEHEVRGHKAGGAQTARANHGGWHLTH
jgi:hypothetical protein